MTYTLPALPYAYDALEPHIDAQTMEIHYTKHHQTYINNLNAAVEGTEFAAWPIEKLVSSVQQSPEKMRAAVINQGGGHANHSLFWAVMSPQGGGKPEGALSKAIDEQLGGFDNFKEVFTKAALTRFGSGWAWLSVTAQKTLVVESSGNQDSPLMSGNTRSLAWMSGSMPITCVIRTAARNTSMLSTALSTGRKSPPAIRLLWPDTLLHNKH